MSDAGRRDFRDYTICLIRLVVAAVAGLVLTHVAGAQPYPTKSIRLVSPYTPGGANDVLARILAQKLTERLGQSVIVDNRPGAGGTLGADIVAKSSPDGYTLLMVALAHAAHESLYRKLPYHIDKDFQPISLVAVQPLILAVSSSLPVKNVKEFVALAKAQPGKLNYGSGGNGTSQHLTMEMFKSVAGIDLVHIPYKGLPQAFIDVINGQLAAVFSPIATILPQMKSSRLKALAIASAKRSPVLPDLPTIDEAGYSGFVSDTWHGIMGPKGLPQAVVNRLNAEIVNAIKLADVQKSLADQGAEPMPMTPEQFGAFITSEIAKYAKVVKDSGAQLD